MVGVTSQVQQLAGSAVPRIRQKDGQASQGLIRRSQQGQVQSRGRQWNNHRNKNQDTEQVRPNGN
ncbi:unnamed protein product, partial [Staurois parvus]